MPTANYNGSASLIRQASDGTDYSVMMEAVTITINPVNDAPVASDFSVSTDEDVVYAFTQGNFTGNFSDVDGDSLDRVRITSLPDSSE